MGSPFQGGATWAPAGVEIPIPPAITSRVTAMEREIRVDRLVVPFNGNTSSCTSRRPVVGPGGRSQDNG